MERGPDILRRRVNDIDANPALDCPPTVCPDICRVIRVMQHVVPVSTPDDIAQMSARDADETARQSCVLRRLETRAPELFGGPIDLDRQFWVAAERPAFLTPRDYILREEAFAPLDDKATMPDASKPAGSGLFTSTASLSRFGMWHDYMVLNDPSSLFPHPWAVWRLWPKNGVRVAEIGSAQAWCELVMKFPRQQEKCIYPNWLAIGDEYDGIHITLPAVVTIQGVALMEDNCLIAPPYWDVESTIWLRWCFSRVDNVVRAEN